MHERIYSIKDEDDTVEFTTWKVRAMGRNENRARRRGRAIAPRTDPSCPRPGARSTSTTWAASPRCRCSTATRSAGAPRIEGPAVIEEETFTGLILHGQRAEVDAQGNYLVSL